MDNVDDDVITSPNTGQTYSTLKNVVSDTSDLEAILSENGFKRPPVLEPSMALENEPREPENMEFESKNGFKEPDTNTLEAQVCIKFAIHRLLKQHTFGIRTSICVHLSPLPIITKCSKYIEESFLLLQSFTLYSHL